MSAQFDRAFDLIVGSEGEYSNDPKDPGGETKFGITVAVARAAGYAGEMRDLPLDFAKTVYRAQYWDACQCDALGWRWAIAVFDCAVNQGVVTAVRLMQDALGVMVDGKLGPRTLQAVISSNDRHLARFLAKRALAYARLSTFEAFGFGWYTRLFVRAFDTHREPLNG